MRPGACAAPPIAGGTARQAAADAGLGLLQWQTSGDMLEGAGNAARRAFGLHMRSFSTSSIARGNSETLSGPLQRLLTFDLPNGPTRQMELDATVRSMEAAWKLRAAGL